MQLGNFENESERTISATVCFSRVVPLIHKGSDIIMYAEVVKTTKYVI